MYGTIQVYTSFTLVIVFSQAGTTGPVIVRVETYVGMITLAWSKSAEQS